MKMGRSSISDAQYAQSIILLNERHFERLISERVNHSKNAVHSAILEFKETGMPKGMIELIKPH